MEWIEVWSAKEKDIYMYKMLIKEPEGTTDRHLLCIGRR